MPKSPEDATVKEVSYPDDLPGDKWTILEYAYYDAEDPEDAEELPEEAQYGYWLRAKRAGFEDGETWVSSPRTLREQLLEFDAEEGSTFEVYEAKKGPNQHDPYHFEMDLVEPGDPQ